MATITVSKSIAAPSARVFELFADFENAAENVSGIKALELLNDGPVGVGTRFRETRVMFKKEAAEEMEVTAFEPDRSYTVACESCGCAYESRFDFVESGGGTEVTMTMNSRPLTFMAKLMSPLGALMAGTMKKCIDQDMEDLRAIAEA